MRRNINGTKSDVGNKTNVQIIKSDIEAIESNMVIIENSTGCQTIDISYGPTLFTILYVVGHWKYGDPSVI